MPARLPDVDLTIDRFGHQNDLTPLPVRFRFVHRNITTSSTTTITHASMALNTFRFANYSSSNSHTSALPIPRTVLASPTMPELQNTATSLNPEQSTAFWIILIFTCLGILFFFIFGFFELMRKDNVQEPGMSERETRRVEFHLRNGNTKLDHIVVKVVAVAKQLDSVGKRLDEVHERLDTVCEALSSLTQLEEPLMSGLELREGGEGVEVPDGAYEGNVEDSTGGESGDVGLEDLESKLSDPVPESRPEAEISKEGTEPDSENVEKTWRRHLRSKGYDVNA
ncbi:hypothetical protein E8E13_009433 [Curvularia kusanoi]|uniref:Uncharacterized protein n=1 Tax=Curvularia kusanoi TaxID=90978 RepID=A0A9P4TGT6_CURKU|nr:hypothetical protein E8E13_009433 [Curvularia kusanoi]